MRESYLLETQLCFQRLQVRSAAPSRLCVDISFLFCLASSVTKALSGDRPVYWWRGEALPGEGNAGCVGPLGRRGGQRVRWVH